MNALMRQNYETSVAANETIEGTLASLRDKIDRNHAVVMANCAQLAAGQAALNEKIHQTHLTLSEKIESVHTVLRDKIDLVHTVLSAKIDSVHTVLSGKIDSVHIVLNDKIDQLRDRMDERYATLGKELGEKIEKNTIAVANLAGMQKAILWVLGSGVLGGLIAVLGRVYHWF
jgi:hypothetical protein